ncbi:ankyrin repeat protein [Parasponia andersonii]|uniref:Ankyrin repeat protein n=1 Tax=Parasponia andersonii TaxID=3476 RepID=A0A2P5C9J0_PARAD|nr:ankyrin repeat protein [Parasponia andersonii]
MADKKWGKGKDKIDDEDVTFQRMVAKINIVWFPDFSGRNGDLGFYRVVDASRCKRLQEKEVATFMDEAEQMEAEEDAERLLRRTEKRAFAAFKISFCLVDSSPASVPLPLRVEPKPKSGIRQQDLLKKVVEIKPKRHRVSSRSDGNQSTPSDSAALTNLKSETKHEKEKGHSLSKLDKAEGKSQVENPVKSLLGLAYASSDDDE